MADPDEVQVDPKLAAKRAQVSALPAIYVDTWSVSWWTGHIRLTLGEVVYGASNFRTAVILELEDAEKLGKHLVDVVARQRARDAVEPDEPDEPDEPLGDET